jgi:hypothetical protein
MHLNSARFSFFIVMCALEIFLGLEFSYSAQAQPNHEPRTPAQSQAQPPAQSQAQLQELSQELSPSQSPALPDSRPPTIRFAAIMQFVEGNVIKIEGQERAPLTFKSPVYEREKILVERNGVAKFVSSSMCIAVVYGNSLVQAPHADRGWSLKSNSFRWICGPGQSDTLRLKDKVFTVSDAEIFYHNGRLLVIRGSVTIEDEPAPLSARKIFQLEKERFTDITSKYTALDLWNFNQQEKPPKEGALWAQPAKPAPAAKPTRPPAPFTKRFIFGPILGGGGSISSGSDARKQDNNDVSGAHLQGHFKFKDKSLIIMFGYRELMHPDSKGQSNTPVTGARSETDLYHLDVGVRFKHDRWWSPYARVGLGQHKLKLFINRSDAAFSEDRTLEYYDLTAAGGLDAKVSLWPRWFGLYGAIELQLTQSLLKGANRLRNEYKDPSNTNYQVPAEAMNIPGSLFTTALLFRLGIMAQF